MADMESRKEKFGFKAWVKKHKVGITIGIMSVGGAAVSTGLYLKGMSDGYTIGYKKGYDEGLNELVTSLPDNKIIEF